ncbi:MAG: thiamine phosphate synthase [Gammaproteobacteria bacterium]
MTPGISLPSGGLYVITDCRNLTTGQLLDKTEQILQAGAALLQYRHKEAGTLLKIDQAGLIKSICLQYSVPLIINDDPELALKVKAEGVHLGREDMGCASTRALLGPQSIIGISCYNDLERAKSAAAGGADYVALGAFYRSLTKPDAARAEPELIARVKQFIKQPVVAIGGITPENGKALLAAGADFLAVSSGLYTPADTGKATRNYVALFNHP